MSDYLDVDEYIFYGAKITPPLSIITTSIRDDPEHISGVITEENILNLLNSIVECSNCRSLLLTIESGLSKPSKLRTKKWEMLLKSEFDLDRVHNLALPNQGGVSRIGSIVELTSHDFKLPGGRILNSIGSILILTSLSTEHFIEKSVEWVKLNGEILPFDFLSISNSLQSYRSTAVIRYLPATNGRCELLGAIGNKQYVDQLVYPCIQAAKNKVFID